MLVGKYILKGVFITFKKAKLFFLTLVLMGVICSITYAETNKVTQPPSSLGGANYYELKPSKYFVSLGVKGYQQTTNFTCGQSAVMNLMRYYNMLSDADMNHKTEMRIAEEMHKDSPNHFGTMPSEMIPWLEKHGFDVTYGENGTLEMLRDNLKKGIPTLVAWSDWGGHWVLVDGYYAGSQKFGDTIFFADSFANGSCVNSPNGITSFAAIRFAAMWYDYDTLLNKALSGRYIIAVPHKK